MTREITTAQFAILDGSWQETPDTLAIFDEGATRGTLYLAVEVIGDSSDRDALARNMIETAHREYAGSRGSITLALTQAVRAVNDFFYNHNFSMPREARCIAGITAAALRDGDLFIAQGGPGLVCHVRGAELVRYPSDSPWFVPDEPIGDFPTPGAVPIGLRRDYTPDLSYIKLAAGDTVLLATRALVHLFSDEELVDAIARHPADAIIENLEDLAGSADLSVIAIQAGGERAAEPGFTPPFAAETPEPETARRRSVMDRFSTRDKEPEGIEPAVGPEPEPLLGEEIELVLEEEPEPLVKEEAAPPAPTEDEIEAIRIREERRRARRARINAGIWGAASGAMRGLADIGSRVDSHGIGTAIDRAIANVLGVIAWLIRAALSGMQRKDRSRVEPKPTSRHLAGLFFALARVLRFFIRVLLPGEPPENPPSVNLPAPRVQTAWRLAALFFPLIIVGVGGGAWLQYRGELDRARDKQFIQLMEQTNAAIKNAEALSKTDKTAARESAQHALKLAEQARSLNPSSTPARSVYLLAQDTLDQVNGISVLLYVPTFASYNDPKAKPSRMALRLPDVFVLDRGTNRVYHYRMDDVGSSAQPASGDGIILKSGEKLGDRALGELIDMTWVELGRLAVLDRAGTFWQYDPKGAWSTRSANDGSRWTRVNLAASFLNNLYLLDPSSRQILKYAPVADAWTSAVTYFAPGITPDLSAAVDMAVDNDVWVLQKDGKILRFNQGKPLDYALRDLETPLSNPVAMSVTQSSLYIADAGNQRIVQFDRATGKFVRQFKPGSTYRDTFSALKTMAVDEASKKIFVLSGSQALFANIPQQ